MKLFNLSKAVGIAAFAFTTVMQAAPSIAQNLFAPVAKVDESIITTFEATQRLRFLQLLNAPGASLEAVRTDLIDERLRLEAARKVGMRLSPIALAAGLAEFAGRAGLSPEAFTAELAAAGIAEETFRDFVRVQLIWRDYIRARYGAQVEISEAEVDRALAASGAQGAMEVLLTEAILAAPPEAPAEMLAQVRAQAEIIAASRSTVEFEDYARRFSASPTRETGGRLEWLALNALPAALHGIILGLAPGDVTDPLPLPNAIALFQMRDIRETRRVQPEYAAIDYAAYYMPAGASAADLREAVDSCDDLYGTVEDASKTNLQRVSLPPADIPRDIAIELAKLDTHEVSTTLTAAHPNGSGTAQVFLMLCGRTAVMNEAAGRDEIARQLRQQRLTGIADSLMEQLRAEARIVLIP